MALIKYYECPVCKRIKRETSKYVSRNSTISCYCEYNNVGTKEKVNIMPLITRQSRKVNGPFKIVGFSNLGYGKSALVKLQKDGETFEIYLSSVSNKVIGKAEIDITLFETKAGGWSSSGHNDDYIMMNGVYRLKQEFEGILYLVNMKYHNQMRPGRYPRVVLETADGVRQFEVFAKDIDMKKILNGAIEIKLREDKTAGSYVWKVVK